MVVTRKCALFVFVWNLWILSTAAAYGGSNVFGVFFQRRRRLEGIQDKRVQIAARRGFAGPNGELLPVKEFEVLQAQRLAESSLMSRIRRFFDRAPDET